MKSVILFLDNSDCSMAVTTHGAFATLGTLVTQTFTAFTNSSSVRTEIKLMG
jgi:hypothetical protein